MATQQRSRGLFPNTPSTDDDAGLLTSSFKSIVGLASAKTAQINIVASFASEDDEVIVQVQKNGVTKNLTFGWNDFKGDALATFVPGPYRLAAHTRGFGITAARIGLTSTASDIRADFSAVC